MGSKHKKGQVLKKEVMIGTGMTAPIREELMALLKNYQDIFA